MIKSWNVLHFFNENSNLPKNNILPKCQMNKSGQYETKWSKCVPEK